MNLGFGTEAAQFLFWEHLFQIFGTVSLQCVAAFRSIPKGKICAIQHVPRDNTRVEITLKLLFSAQNSFETVKKDSMQRENFQQVPGNSITPSTLHSFVTH
jgi:hypothetical protein